MSRQLSILLAAIRDEPVGTGRWHAHIKNIISELEKKTSLCVYTDISLFHYKDVYNLLYALESNDSITSLDFSIPYDPRYQGRYDINRTYINKYTIHYLCSFLKNNKTIQSLNLRNNPLHHEDSHDLCEAIQQNSTRHPGLLVKVAISHRGMAAQFLREISLVIEANINKNINSALVEMRGLNNHGLLSSILSSATLPRRAALLQQLQRFLSYKTSLNIHEDLPDFEATDLNNLLEGLNSNTTITNLDFSRHNLDKHYFNDENIKFLLLFLKINKTVQHLNLKTNWIGDTLCQMIFKALESNITILSLGLCNTNIGNATMRKAFPILVDRLIKLDVSNNEAITDSSIMFLMFCILDMPVPLVIKSEAGETKSYLSVNSIVLDGTYVSNDIGKRLKRFIQDKQIAILTDSVGTIGFSPVEIAGSEPEEPALPVPVIWVSPPAQIEKGSVPAETPGSPTQQEESVPAETGTVKLYKTSQNTMPRIPTPQDEWFSDTHTHKVSPQRIPAKYLLVESGSFNPPEGQPPITYALAVAAQAAKSHDVSKFLKNIGVSGVVSFLGSKVTHSKIR